MPSHFTGTFRVHVVMPNHVKRNIQGALAQPGLTLRHVASISCAHLQDGKTSGADGIPADFWKAMLVDSVVLDAVLHLCNQRLRQKMVPDEWGHASVFTIFKKGGHIIAKQLLVNLTSCSGLHRIGEPGPAEITTRRIRA